MPRRRPNPIIQGKLCLNCRLDAPTQQDGCQARLLAQEIPFYRGTRSLTSLIAREGGRREHARHAKGCSQPGSHMMDRVSTREKFEKHQDNTGTPLHSNKPMPHHSLGFDERVGVSPDTSITQPMDLLQLYTTWQETGVSATTTAAQRPTTRAR